MILSIVCTEWKIGTLVRWKSLWIGFIQDPRDSRWSYFTLAVVLNSKDWRSMFLFLIHDKLIFKIEPTPYLNYYNSWTPMQQWVKYRYLFVSLCYFYMCELSLGQYWCDHGGCDTERRDSAVPSSLSLHLAGEQAKDGQWLINRNSHAWKGA